MHNRDENGKCGAWRGVVVAGLAYTGAVFPIAFAVGTVRVTWVAPHTGALAAVLLEAPVVLSASWVLAGACCRRFGVDRSARARALMGIVAFVALMTLEVGVSLMAFGETLAHFLARNRETPGLVGLVIQVAFAAIPWLRSRRAHASVAR